MGGFPAAGQESAVNIKQINVPWMQGITDRILRQWKTASATDKGQYSAGAVLQDESL